jgi:1A family penicillin-binding protein
MPKRRFYRKIYQKRGKRNKLIFVLKLLVFCFLFSVFSLFSLFIFYARDLPRPEKFTEKELAQSTKIFDRSGEILLYEIYGEEKRSWVPLEKIPDHLIKAVIATEDAHFYHHPGVDFRGIIRAVLSDLKIQKFQYGGSTIPQQLVRSTFLSLKKTVERKTKEVILTLELERRYSKDQILEWYLNQIPFGRNTYGVEAASYVYFQKSVSGLSLAESSILAALIRAPSYYSAEGNLNELLMRKNYVLDRVVTKGFITKEEGEMAKKEEINFVKVTNPIKAPHFVMYVRNYLIKKYGEEELKRKGFRVYTTLDWELQEWAEKVVKEGAEKNRQYGVYNASLVAISPKTGEVLSLVGSADWYATSSEPKGCQANCKFEPKFDVAILGERQPGSAFKPFVYGQAFEKGYTPETILWDVETNFGDFAGKPYIPQNYDNKSRGPVNLRNALAQSINVPSVKVLYLAGVKDSIELAKRMGITTLNKPEGWYGLSLVLGGGEVKLLDMVSAYGAFATEGLKLEPVFISKIIDAEGKIIEENKRTPERILEKEIARLINDILSDNEARAPLYGPRSSLYFENAKVAAKTGTTQNYRDAWTIGYTPSIVAGVWAGNNDHSEPKTKTPSIIKAGHIWKKFMEKTILKYSGEDFTPPKPPTEIGGGLTSKPILNGVIENPAHSILHYVKKDDPRGTAPENPFNDAQYERWERGIENWIQKPQ